MSIFLSAQNLSYKLDNEKVLFKDLTFSISSNKKIALIGKNGVGKSSLLSILAGQTAASSGSLISQGTIHFMQQIITNVQSVIEALGKKEEYFALSRIEQGVGTEQDFELVNNDWDLESNIAKELAFFKLSHLRYEQSYLELSGGEKVRLALAKAFLSDSDILLLDEPTNNLDSFSKALFIKRILAYKKAILIVTHDRDVLEKIELIFELSPLNMKSYGGNYSFYCQEKNKEQVLLEEEQNLVKKELEAVNNTAQTIKKQQATRNSTGKKNAENSKWTVMVAGINKNSSELSQGKVSNMLKRKQEEAEQKAKELEAKIERDSFISLPQNELVIPVNQRILDVQDLSFSYESDQVLLQNINLSIQGAKHIAIEGRSGSGKSTLLKLLLGELQAQSGSVNFYVPVHFLDQNLSFLQNELSVFENFILVNPNAKIQEARYALGRFRFRGDSVEKAVGILSGGEKVKLALACVLGISLPSVLILDEPTNNLDIESISIIESVLKDFAGTLIIVSHDQHCLQAIDITEKYILENANLTKQ